MLRKLVFLAIGGSQLLQIKCEDLGIFESSGDSVDSIDSIETELPEIEVIDYSDVDGDTKPIPGQDPVILRKSSNVLASGEDLSKMVLNKNPEDVLAGFSARSAMELPFDMDALRRRSKPKKNYPAFGSTVDFSWKTKKGDYIFTAQYVKRSTENVYAPPLDCKPIQGYQSGKNLLDFKDARSLIYGAKKVWGLKNLAGIRSVNDNDNHGGNCQPRRSDPVMATGDSTENSGRFKKNRKADFWVSKRMFSWEPSYKQTYMGAEVIPGTCDILTQATGVIFWLCDRGRKIEVNGTIELLGLITNAKLLTDEKFNRGLVDDTAGLITDVGCWCGKLENNPDRISLMGDPLDYEVDEYCHQWNKCKKCAKLSSLACDYAVFGHGYAMIENGADYTCDSQNNDACGQSACECDLDLALKVADFLEHDAGADKSLDPEYMNLIEKDEMHRCVRNKEGEQILADSCCGTESPAWQLFSSEFQCCEHETIFVTKKYGDEC